MRWRPPTASRRRCGSWRAASRAGLRYDIVYNPTEFIAKSVHEVHEDDLRGGHPRRHRRHPVPADLARLDHPDRRDPGLADRHLRGAGRLGLFAQQPVAVRPGAGDRHRRRRRDRRRRECRAQSAARHEPERGGAPDDGRGRRRADRHRAGAVRGVHPGGLHPRHLRPVLPPVRGHDRRRDGDLVLRLADPEPGALRPAVQAASRSMPRARIAADAPDHAFLPRLQLRLRQGCRPAMAS